MKTFAEVQAECFEVCERIADGESLRTIEKRPGMPNRQMVFNWIRRYPEFAVMYHAARCESADAIVEEILDIADDTENDITVDEDGVPRVNHDHINRSRLRIDSRKWIAGKMKPKKYGDRMMHEGSEDGPPIKTSIEVTFVSK